MRAPQSGSKSQPRFLLAGPPSSGSLAPMDPEELRHAHKVLRLAPGALALGLDGAGAAWPLEARAAPGRRGELEFLVLGPPTLQPAPGEPGAALPEIEICLAWPRPGREEPLLERLTQLGAARLYPLIAEHTGPEERGARAARSRRLLLQSLKQCQRLWLPELAPALAVAAVPPAAGLELLLDPGAVKPIAALLTPWSQNRRPLRLWVGPEGGFSRAEADSILARGAQAARLGPHILRIETAAEAALAVAVALLEAAGPADSPKT